LHCGPGDRLEIALDRFNKRIFGKVIATDKRGLHIEFVAALETQDLDRIIGEIAPDTGAPARVSRVATGFADAAVRRVAAG
jgi:hypothetical protein